MKSLSVASLCTIFTVFVMTFLVSAVGSVGTDYSDIRISLLIAWVAAIVSMVVLVIWALPLHYVLKKLERQALHWYLLAAVVPSVIFIYGFKPFGQDSSVDLMKQALFCIGCGFIGAAVFWYMAVFRLRITKRSS
jgi:ABC-type spermidine/putrescine transport system permease subunit II